MNQFPVFLSLTGMAGIVLLSLSVLTGCAGHRDKPRMEIPNPEKRLYILKNRLELTDNQVATIRPIIEEDHAQKTEIMEDMDHGDERAMRDTREKMEDLEWETYKKLSKALTPKQMELYSQLLLEEEEKMQEQMMAQQEGKGRGGRGRPSRSF